MDLDRLYNSDEDIRRKLDRVVAHIDKRLFEERFDEVDVIFERILKNHFATAAEDLSLTIGFLTFTNGAQGELPYRQMFYVKLYSYLVVKVGGSDAKKYIGGLG